MTKKWRELTIDEKEERLERQQEFIMFKIIIPLSGLLVMVIAALFLLRAMQVI